jgi:DNA-binding MarR family transcriptional regulator
MVNYKESRQGSSITELAEPLAIKLPAVMKHLDVLEDAGLVTRSRFGQTMTVRLTPPPCMRQ